MLLKARTQDFNEKDLDVADPAVLAQIADELQVMSKSEASAFLASDEGNEELDRDLEMTRHLGIEARRPVCLAAGWPGS